MRVRELAGFEVHLGKCPHQLAACVAHVQVHSGKNRRQINKTLIYTTDCQTGCCNVFHVT